MKTLILVALLLATYAAPAHSDDPRTCNGRVRNEIETVGDGLYPRGHRLFVVGDCVVTADKKRILRTCPLGSYCRIEGTSEGDGELSAIDSIKRITARQVPIYEYQDMIGRCHAASEAAAETYCDAAARQGQKLKTKGFCLGPRDMVGRPGKDGRCDWVEW